MIQKELCLVGNPNCGKTTLFNLLTGAYQKVGNWAGVTVDKKQGFLRNDKRVKITDLPGLYSLTPNSPDEAVVTEFLKTFTGVIVNVIDGTSLERSLFLTLSLLRLGLPMVVGINMMDQLKKEKAKLNLGEISKFLGVPVFEMGTENPVNIATEAIKLAKDQGYDYVFLDTAGRLHIDEELMNELKAVKANAHPHEILLVVDSMTGQDAVNVASTFNDALGIDGLVLTKLDGTAKGGIVLSIKQELGIPVKFIGVGEKIDDMQEFDAKEFTEALFN